MSSCAICYQSTQCYRCENRDLKIKIQSLQQELSKYYTSDIEKFTLSYYDKQLSQEFITKYSDKPILYDYKNELSTSHFVTITFDPAKFGMQMFDDERQQYIIHKLYNLMSKDLIKKCYGSFERHKNGIIHSHLIINAQQEDIKKITKLLKSYFTDNPYNKIAIDIGPAKYPQAMEYIEKESDNYYLIIPKEKTLTKCLKQCFKNPNTQADLDGEFPVNITKQIMDEVDKLHNIIR